MEWFSQNWVWVLFAVGMIAMHMFGHGGHLTDLYVTRPNFEFGSLPTSREPTDENFLRVKSVVRVHGSAAVTGQSMCSRICQWTKLPIYIGFGESNTSAKFADDLAYLGLKRTVTTESET